MLTFSFLALAVASSVLSVAANPIVSRSPLITLPLAKLYNTTGTKNIVENDVARIRHLRGGLFERDDAAAVDDAPATNIGISYTVTIGVGTPPTQYTLIVDTGSSNTWVGANSSNPYVSSSSSSITLNAVGVTYGSGSFSGLEYSDVVTVGSVSIKKQGVGSAFSSSGFTDVDGILGIGPTDLTIGTLFPSILTSIPTVTDNAFSQGLIPENIVAISFEPTNTDPNTNGELTFGGTDPSKFTGPIMYTSITTTSPASKYWGIDQSIAYGNKTIMNDTSGIVDTGTTLIYLPTDAFNAYQSATGAVLDSTTGFLKITTDQYNTLQNLNFLINDVPFTLVPNAQIWPRALNSVINGTPGSIYLVVGNSGSVSGSGLDFINGQTFLERFYGVYDTTNKRVGLATTSFTDATTN